MSVPRALTRAQTVIARTFTVSATIMRKAQLTDDAGGFTETYAAVATYDCSFARYPVRPFEREQGTFVRVVAMWTFVFSTDADVEPTDRIAIGAFDVDTDIADVTGRIFEVVDPATGSLDVVRRVICEEIT